MGSLIAVNGKGGVGKTTVAGLLVSRLAARGRGPVLAVDADPNMCLDGALGVTVKSTVGSAREQVRDAAGKGMSAGVSKQEILEMKIEQSLVEAGDFDLIAMGRSEGPGCYCYANNVLRNAITALSKSYPVTVIDNEAGLENLSRRIVQKVGVMIIVSDPSARGLETARRLHAMTSEMGISYDKLVMIVNRLKGDRLPALAESVMREIKADFIAGLPEDDVIAVGAERGQSVFSVPGDNAAVKAIDDLLDKLEI
jgi:CO dehydrogenase maturation factor